MADGLQIDVQIYGIKEALRELNKVAPTMRRQITKDAKRVFSPSLKQLSSALPSTPYLNGDRKSPGMEAKWRVGGPGGRQILPTEWAKVPKGTIKIDTRRARSRNRMSGAQYESAGAFAFIWSNPIANVLEFTGTGKKPYKGNFPAQSANFVKQITKKSGAPIGSAKFVWHKYDTDPTLQRQLEQQTSEVLDDAIKIINAELGKNLGRK